MTSIKLTLIGAGSPFTFHVLADLIRRPALAGSLVALVDINPAALDLSTRIARRMIQESGANLKLESSTKRQEMLPGSDFVLNSISVGEPWARERDVAIGEEYGIYQPTSQTVGPAGFVRGLRVVPHVVAIAQDIALHCPDATVLDLANPLSAVCRAMIREAEVNVIGLCEQWKFTMPVFSKALGIPVEQLDCLSVGLNHFAWALALYHQGRDVLGDFIERVYSPEGKAVYDSVPVSREIYETFGLWPTGTEDHTAEWFNYFLTRETHGGADYGMSIRHVTPEQYEARMAERRDWADGRKPITSLLGPSGESAVEIIAQLLGLEPAGLQMVNIPNAGLIDNLPYDAIVELPAHVSPAGVRGLKVGELPLAVAQVLQTRVTQQELLVDAALTGDRQTALQGMLLDAQITSLKVGREILERSLAANAEWLPAFKS